MSKSTETAIEIVSDPREEHQSADHPVALDHQRLAAVRRSYARQWIIRLDAQQMAAQASVEMDLQRTAATEMLRSAGWSWEQILEELKSWH